MPPTATPATDEALLVTNDVTAIGFSVAPQLRGEFDLNVDRIQLYRQREEVMRFVTNTSLVTAIALLGVGPGTVSHV